MKISPISRNIYNNKINYKTNLPNINKVPSYTYSFSGRKNNYLALFMAGLLTLSSAGGLTGCQKTQKTNETSVSIQASQKDYSSIDLAEKLQNKLFAYEDKLTMEDAQNELYKFMSENSIDNVVIEDINNPSDKSRENALRMKQTLAAFWSVPDDNINYNQGTLYIDKSADLSDKMQRTLFITEAVHEITHALQFSKDTTKQGLKGIMDTMYEADSVFSFLNTGIGYFDETYAAVQIARNAAISQYIDLNLDENDKNDIQNNINKYQLSLYDKPVTLSDEIVKDGITEYAQYMCGILEPTFEDTINRFADDTVNIFLNATPHNKDEEEKLSKALISAAIYMFRAEAEAYTAGNNALKKAQNMGNQNILMDYIPKSYTMIADVLQQRLEN